MCWPSVDMSNSTGISSPLSSLYGLSKDNLRVFQGRSSDSIWISFEVTWTWKLSRSSILLRNINRITGLTTKLHDTTTSIWPSSTSVAHRATHFASSQRTNSMIKSPQQYQMSVLVSTKKRKLDDDDTARILSKKQRTRVRYNTILLLQCHILYHFPFSFSCGECHRRKQKVK